MKKGHIFFIMWISWSGKWTLIMNLKQQDELDLTFMKSYVTRPMREWETDWNIYNFISLDEFEKWVDTSEFLEYQLVHGLHYYWTKYVDVIENWINKWKKVVKEVEIKWLKSIFETKPELREHITSIFLDISEKELTERIKKRWAEMSAEELQNRKNSLKFEKTDSKIYCDYIIDTSNKSKEQTLEAVLEIIKKN